MWHRQKFSLRIERTGDSWCLAGSLEYAENVLDEWFVVSLLFHITKHVDLVGRVTDSDGEFLLIEAASVLPPWAADPSKAEGRVFILRGKLPLLPVNFHMIYASDAIFMKNNILSFLELLSSK